MNRSGTPRVLVMALVMPGRMAGRLARYNVGRVLGKVPQDGLETLPRVPTSDQRQGHSNRLPPAPTPEWPVDEAKSLTSKHPKSDV